MFPLKNLAGKGLITETHLILPQDKIVTKLLTIILNTILWIEIG